MILYIKILKNKTLNIFILINKVFLVDRYLCMVYNYITYLIKKVYKPIYEVFAMVVEEQEAFDYFYDVLLCNEDDIKDDCETWDRFDN
ncbi:Uncharacterised protein [Streptococcus pneumoniae]|nr:Uncharacterised protein [Streptococcus pneumoniae]